MEKIVTLASRYVPTSEQFLKTVLLKRICFGLTHFSIATQQKDPFLNPLHTTLTKVKDIPYFVSQKFMRTYYRDRYQLAQVERMVENAYENYLVAECNSQKKYKRSLIAEAEKKPTAAEQERATKIALDFELSRCVELNDLFPLRTSRRY